MLARNEPLLVTLSAFLLVAAPAAFAKEQAKARYVSARTPVIGSTRELSAVRPAFFSPKHVTPSGKSVNTWTKLATLSGAVVHDVAFVSPDTGYAAAELGQVWKTTNGGKNWTKVLNRNFPYYYYGIYAVGDTVLASGFNNQTGEGILSSSDNGGTSWNDDVVLGANAWAGRVRFAHDLKQGLAMNGLGSPGSNPNIAWWAKAPQKRWHADIPDPNGGWFGYQFTLLRDKSAFASGITFCKSADVGATWSCAPPADSVFDGPTEFVNAKFGWTGGGEISPDVAGWLHRTTDGGATWSDRVLSTPWPVRQISFLSKKIGWAAGGNVYSDAGGIYYSADGGKSWVLDVDTGDEMDACAHQPIGSGSQTQVWCIGFLFNGSNFASDVYSTVVNTP